MTNESPIPGLKVAGPNDLIELLKLVAVMDYRWITWLNQRVLDAIEKNWSRRLTHLKFLPDVENGLLYVLPALKEEYGALPLDYSPAEGGATISLYLPLIRFDLRREEGRNREFDLVTRQVAGVTYMAFDVVNSRSVPARRRREKAATETTPAADAAAAESDGDGSTA